MRFASSSLALAGLMFTLVLTLTACSDDDPSPSAPDTATDRELATLAQVATGFTWFGSDPALRPRSAGSGHTTGWLRTRYNLQAATQLDSVTGRVRADAVFPTGSLIVKELHGTELSTRPDQLAVIQKNPASPQAAPNGWIWAIYNPDGSPVVSATAKGTGCASCHAQTDNIDATLMNKFFR